MDFNMNKISVTAKDGTSISAITFGIEDSGTKAIVIISHGFGEYSGSYIDLAGELQKAGYASIIPDQRGHGKPPEGVKKWQGLIPRYRCFTDDIISVTKAARQMLPDTPMAIDGHSMGGNIVATTLLRSSPEQAAQYTCALLEAPWIRLYKQPGILKICLANILSCIIPNYIMSSEPKRDTHSGGTDIETDDTKDPLYHSLISMRMLAGLFNGCAYVLKNAARFPIPTLLATADNEHTVCNKAIARFAEKAGDIVTAREYKSNHAIHNDANRKAYFRDVIEYLDLKFL
jgi:alpha-beta hydrolase superfamily lysophospholipase